MLSQIKELVKQRQSDIFLAVFIVLIALISFGAGRLTAEQTEKEPIIIQQPSASVEQILTKEESKNKSNKQSEQKVFVASINSNKYHWPDCPSAKKISPENQVWFSSEAEAQAAGYIRCANFEKYAPAGYKNQK